MKKLLLVFIASIFIFSVSNAQLFNYGIKAGIGFSSLKFDDITGIIDGGDVYDLITGDGVTGYHVGLQTRIKVAMLVIQPELYFNAGGGTLQQVVDGGANEILNVKFSRIDLPLLVGVKLGPARINAGPVGSFVISENTDLSEIEPDFELFSNSMTWGFQAGLGLDISKLSLDVRYEGSLSQLGESFTVGGTDFALDARPSQWIISLGFWFR
ncbi:MAG: porin family protein [Bacteroidales bacterium]|nr:porin family protein [Bacteroidales bacterium]